MKVTFIHHSSFCVETDNRVLVFDYFKGDRIPELQFQGKMPEFPSDTPIYVFSSHKHQDHFDIEVLKWVQRYPKIQYIFSKDIHLGENYLKRNGIDPQVKEKIHFMKENTSLMLDGMEIETLLSTDEGVAFLVTAGGRTIYHAGDLHWWHWEGEDAAFNEYQEKTYKRQIDKLKGRKLDLAFVVIDKRLKDAVFWGMDYFMEQADASAVIPMHLWQEYGLIGQYKAREAAAACRDRILEVTQENQVFEL